MQYADTCLLVSVFISDSGTDAALAWLEQAAGEPLLASHWSLTEFSCAAANLARQRKISAKLHTEAQKRFRQFAADRLTLESISPSDFNQASHMVEHYASGLRAGDAVHLALCQRLNATLCTADKVMANAAKARGIALLQL